MSQPQSNLSNDQIYGNVDIPTDLRNVSIENINENKIRASLSPRPTARDSQIIDHQGQTHFSVKPRAPQFNQSLYPVIGRINNDRYGQINNDGSISARNYYSDQIYRPTRQGGQTTRSHHHHVAVPTQNFTLSPPTSPPNEILLEEIADEYEEQPHTVSWKNRILQSRGLLHPYKRRVKSLVLDAMTDAKVAIHEAKEATLNCIYDDSNEEARMPMPPCPPCTMICRCAKPARIRRIEDMECHQCGQPAMQCDICCGMCPRCPYCGKRTQPQLNCALEYLASPCELVRGPPRPQPLPELVVTSVGPFSEKKEVVETPVRSTCCPKLDLSGPALNLAFDCGQIMGSYAPCCKKEPPPMPVPGRPVQRLLPFCFPSPPHQKDQKFPFNLFKKRTKRYQPPRGGLAGVLEDLFAVGIGGLATVLEVLSDFLESETKEIPGAQHCDCKSPPLRYPKNGMYDDPPLPPTKATGNRIIDAFNNFLDAATFPPSKPEDVQVIPDGEIPETEETGNKIIDTINRAIDSFLTTKEEKIKPSEYGKHNPLQALMTYFTVKPTEVHDEGYIGRIVPCLATDKSGRTCIDRSIPTCPSNNISSALPQCGPERVDYVNFSIVPGTIFEESCKEERNHERVMIPIPSV